MTTLLGRPTRRKKTVADTGSIYGYRTLRVDRATGFVLGDGTIEVGYVGQTKQSVEDRDAQHRGLQPNPYQDELKPQPWSDIIHGEIFVIEAGVPVDQLDAREQHHIEQLMPVYNWLLQVDEQPNQIPPSEARRHRDARDAAQGLTPREWPPFRSGWQPQAQPTAERVQPRVVRTPRVSTSAATRPAQPKTPRRQPAPVAPVPAESTARLAVRAGLLFVALTASLWTGLWWLVDALLGVSAPPEVLAFVAAFGAALLTFTWLVARR